ncbi:MAG: chemotaxis-specific protein-glutamate methyltransferase CheB [Gemmatimonadaceae bacterium]
MTPPVRVLVVEDSLTVRRRLCDVLAADPAMQVVGEAEDGKQGIERCMALRPDVVTMDMMMPVMTGLGAAEYIMAHCPTPILIVSSSTNRGELFKTYEALAAGAVDVLEKPRGDEPAGEWEARFISALKMVARIRVVTHPRASLAALGQGRPDVRTPVAPISSVAPRNRCELVVIGASTGGPGAILEILRALRPPLPVPVLFVLHIDEPFAAAFAEWLDAQTEIRVAYARDGDRLSDRVGSITMAPADHHLIVKDGRLRLTQDPPRHSCRPSIDVLFESVAREFGPSAVGCLLTGMGRDGASGLLDLRNNGAFTIAQDEASSVVYGMPREAVRLGAAARELPLREIAKTLGTLLGKPGAGRKS